MGIPILDVIWTIIRRLARGKNPFKFSDREHLHHRLLDLGLNQKQTVLVFYGLSLIFGLSGLFLQSQGKLLALIFLVVLMAAIVVSFSFIKRKKPTLLMQICCAPCGGYTLNQILNKKYDITLYFCNPNLDSKTEFHKRLQGVIFLAQKFNWPLIIEDYNHEAWRKMVAGREADPERGPRCQLCYRDRLVKTAKLAATKKFAYFGTTLTVSPYKDSAAIMNIGREVAQKFGGQFLEYDFKINDGFKKSQEFAKRLGIYRQKYCGCKF